MGFDLPAGVHPLHAETTWSTGQNARTLYKYDDFRVVLIALGAEARMQEHKAEDRISIHLRSGHVELRASGRTFSLRSGGARARPRRFTRRPRTRRERSCLRLPGREEDDG